MKDERLKIGVASKEDTRGIKMKDERLKIKDRGSQQRRYQRHSAGAVCKEDAVRPLAMKMPEAVCKEDAYGIFFVAILHRTHEI